mmetsp:Transcript_12274/g.51635  ORF Transcript_12274/g.51635 Transcript_12274/m.51635 type:complete len:235 (+) Transcript_12274:1531-2235(+)
MPAGGVRRGVQLQGWGSSRAPRRLHRPGRAPLGAVHVRRRGRDGEQGSVRGHPTRQARGLDPRQVHPRAPREGGHHRANDGRGINRGGEQGELFGDGTRREGHRVRRASSVRVERIERCRTNFGQRGGRNARKNARNAFRGDVDGRGGGGVRGAAGVPQRGPGRSAAAVPGEPREGRGDREALPADHADGGLVRGEGFHPRGRRDRLAAAAAGEAGAGGAQLPALHTHPEGLSD